jgi:hypothetical protein
MNILQAMSDKKLFRPWFKDMATWEAWRAFLALLFNLPMSPGADCHCAGLYGAPGAAGAAFH